MDQYSYFYGNSQLNEHPEVVHALKALPCGERYLPAYEAHEYLLAKACPLDAAILEVLMLPKDDLFGALAEIERRFKVNRRTVYRHRDHLCCEMACATMAFLYAHLKIHRLEEHAEKILKILDTMI
jgi:hypothetical protein